MSKTEKSRDSRIRVMLRIYRYVNKEMAKIYKMIASGECYLDIRWSFHYKSGHTTCFLKLRRRITLIKVILKKFFKNILKFIGRKNKKSSPNTY